jgi:multidrug efflux system membrane fusion protein
MKTLFDRRYLRYWVAVAVLAAFLVGLLLRTGRAAPAAPAGVPAVAATLVPVQQKTVPIVLPGVGTVQPLATVTVRTRLDGQLERVNFHEGQDVHAGQVLAQIDARALQAQLEQARAQRARDAAQLVNAQRDLKRYTQLLKEDAATRQMVDTQKALVAQLQAATQTDDAQIHYAQVQLDYATIKAPLSGRTGVRLVDPGNIVHASDATGLVVINQIDPIAVMFTLPGDAVQSINTALNKGKPLPVFVYGRDEKTELASGELVLVNNQIDVTSGTVKLKARFPNAAHVLWPGQYVNVRLHVGEFDKALTVPASAIQRQQAGTYVYSVDPQGKAHMRPVEVAQIQDGQAVVTKGLTANDTVVALGHYKIKPGVQVVPAKSSAADARDAEK